MLIRAQEELDRLPPHEAIVGQRRDGWRGEGIFAGLQRVVTTQGFVNEGDAEVGGFEEKAVVVATNETVEVGELRGCERAGFPRGNMFGLVGSAEIARAGRRTTDDVVRDRKQQLLKEWRRRLVRLYQIAPILLFVLVLAHGGAVSLRVLSAGIRYAGASGSIVEQSHAATVRV